MDDAQLNEFLYRSKLAKRGENPTRTSLAGGVSSDIWRVDLPGKTICVKRALAKLKVAANWSAPIERNNYEWEWFKFVHRYFPEIVPTPIAHDSEMQMLAMDFLESENFPVWKSQLLNGIANPKFAAQVGSYLGKIHAKSAGNSEAEKTFATDKLFYALRIEPYLLATAEKHPKFAAHIKQIAAQTLSLHVALVHGDVSPKNILVGKNGPIFLDAETAWYGDPAFDLAFCLNHFLLKCAFRPQSSKDYLFCFKAFADNYLNEVDWEASEKLERRTAQILPILILARIDGKSPVEYLPAETVKNQIRQIAANLFMRSPKSLSDDIWKAQFKTFE